MLGETTCLCGNTIERGRKGLSHKCQDCADDPRRFDHAVLVFLHNERLEDELETLKKKLNFTDEAYELLRQQRDRAEGRADRAERARDFWRQKYECLRHGG